MDLNTVDQVMGGLSSIAAAGERQSKRIRNILKLAAIHVKEHDEMMAVPEWRDNYVAFLGQEGLDIAVIVRDNLAQGIDTFIQSGIISQEEIDLMISKG